jgi:uncharacterized membrane protein
MLLLCAFLVGVVAGLRSMMAPAVVSWFAHLNRISVGSTYVALMNYRITAVVFSILAVAELVADKLPKTPSRVGTLGGAAVRGKLASAFGRDLPAAILEDIAALAIAIFSILKLG